MAAAANDPKGTVRTRFEVLSDNAEGLAGASRVRDVSLQIGFDDAGQPNRTSAFIVLHLSRRAGRPQ